MELNGKFWNIEQKHLNSNILYKKIWFIVSYFAI